MMTGEKKGRKRLERKGMNIRGSSEKIRKREKQVLYVVLEGYIGWKDT